MDIQLDLFDPNKQILYDLFKAYYNARKNKRNTINQLRFEQNYESNLLALYNQIVNRNYKIDPSICFINFDPVQREIFAANFKDRIVHHLIFNYINPIFERVFINDSYSCRIGKGTSYGIKRISHFIRSCTQNYKHEAYILKLDIKGYFMAMNRNILYNKVLATLIKHQQLKSNKLPEYIYKTVVYLIETVIFNNPTKNCIIKGNKSDWQGLPASKSLFKADKNCGLPIGNLTSQLFGNVYMNDLDHFIKIKLKCKYYGRYVDDFFIINQNKDYLKQLIPQISEFLQKKLQLTLHPNKIYLQAVEKGVQFLGATIKPHRIYLKNRTKGNFYTTLQKWNNYIENKSVLTKQEVEKFVSSINSYLGISLQYNTFKLRKKMILKNMSKQFWNYVYLSNYRKLKIKQVVIAK